MNTLPIVDRELLVRSRQGTTYWGRCLLAGIAALAGVQYFSSQGFAVAPTTMGPEMFEFLSWMAFLLVCFSCLATADCVSSERREGTLGLLFLTDLEGRDVVLGKLTAAGVSVFYGILGFLPALALVFLAGGISGGEFGRTALSLLNALFVSLAAGLFVSAHAQRQFRAMTQAAILVGIFFVWSWVASHLRSLPPMKAALFAMCSPYGAFYLAADGLYAPARSIYWAGLILEHGAAWLLLAATNSSVKRKWQTPDKLERRFKSSPPPSVGTPTPASASETPATEPAVPAASHAPRARDDDSWALLEQEPVCWAVSRTAGHNFYLWLGALLLLLSGAVPTLTGGLATSGVELLMSLGASALLAWAAGRSLFEARRDGELELLLVTPLGARDIIRGHWWALWRPLRAAWLLAVFVLVLQFVENLGHLRGGSTYASSFVLVWALLAPINKVLDGVAVCWVGMWYGLRARKPLQVVTWTSGLVIALPWVFLIIAGLLLAGLNVTESSVMLILPVVDMAKNILFIFWASRNLRAELRATEPLGSEEWLK